MGAVLATIARHGTAAAILVALIQAVAEPDLGTVELLETMTIFGVARGLPGDRKRLLGYARLHGLARTTLYIAAVLAGSDGAAYPADGAP